MNAREFYDHVAEWSIKRRELANIQKPLTEAMLVITRKEAQQMPIAPEDIELTHRLKEERARLEFVINGIIDTIDAEVDRVEAMLKKKAENDQKTA